MKLFKLMKRGADKLIDSSFGVGTSSGEIIIRGSEHEFKLTKDEALKLAKQLNELGSK